MRFKGENASSNEELKIFTINGEYEFVNFRYNGVPCSHENIYRVALDFDRYIEIPLTNIIYIECKPQE